MKKFLMTSVLAAIVVALFLLVGCGGGDSAEDVNLFKLLPENASAVFYVNFKKMVEQPYYDKMIKEMEEEKEKKADAIFEDYQDFIAKTGIDPKKDVIAMAGAVLGEFQGDKTDFVFVSSINFDKEKVTKIIKEKAAGKYDEENYDGVVIYKIKDGKDAAFTFLGSSVAAIGKYAAVKTVVDLHKGKGKNVLSNDKLKPYINAFPKGKAFSFVFDLPENVKKEHDTKMMGKVDFTKAEVLNGFMDYASETFSGEIVLVNPDEAGNTQIVNVLNAAKGLAAMAGPEVVEITGTIKTFSSANDVKITFDIPQAMLDKMEKKMKSEKKPAEEEATEEETTEEKPVEGDAPADE